MKSTDVIQPIAISQPIATEGLKFDIPETATGTEKASIAEGFPEITMQALDDGGKPPRGQDCNGMFYLSTDQRVYLQNGGIITFNKDVSDLIGGYPQNAILDYLDPNGDYYKVKSLIDDNTYNFIDNPTYIDDEKWTLVTLGGGGTGSGLEVGDIGMALFVDETKGLRRYLNGSILAITTNTKRFLQFLQNLKATTPSLFDTEENWQAAKTASAFGQVGKFVLNYAEDGTTVESVRLPAVVNVQGLLNLSNLGMTVAAGLPNITGFASAITIGLTENIGVASGAFTKTSGSKTGGTGGNSIHRADLNFNASASNSIYGNSSTVQEEAIQYPYFIQVATGSTTTVDITNEIELNNPFFYGMSIYSETAPNNLSWLKSSGQWNTKAVYPDYYNWLLTSRNTSDSSTSVMVPNVTTVGTIAINNGIATGFSNSSYLTMDIGNPSNVTEVEIVMSFNTGTWSDVENQACGLIGGANFPRIQIYNGKLNLGGDTSTGNYTFNTNEDATIKVTIIGTDFKIYRLDSDGEYVLDYSFIYSGGISGVVNLGQCPNTTSSRWLKNGSIDLYDTNLTINNVLIWAGMIAESNIKLASETYDDYDYVINLQNETFRLPLLNGSEDLPTEYNTLSLPTASGQKFIAPYNGVAYIYAKTTANGQYINLYNLSTGIINESRPYGTPVGSSASLWVNKGDEYLINADVVSTITTHGISKATGNGSLYYYVGETVQNANLIDAGRLTEQLVSLKSNQITMAQAAHASMPSTRYVNLTLGAVNAKYTMPADGWLEIWAVGKGTAYLHMAGPRVNAFALVGNNPTGAMMTYLPVAKGDTVSLNYNDINSVSNFRFVYAQGAE